MMFNMAVTYLSEQLSANEFIPCSSLASARSIKDFSMVQRDRLGRYTVTSYTINDLMASPQDLVNSFILV
ncbi:hypothetical protein EB796_014630 [Bugula neritina]|uniref:Uncharacterized protein n=1 Tax=Bugula neritina TaxID=10212 RepID=A0A7J7JL47_BUGNE|nr:hypothetical protein EB796_014630 [Bugula neritina]